MSKSLKLAAMAAAMVAGSTSVYATGGGLTAAQVRAIVKQEVAKLKQGPRGPRGPAGMDGLPSLFAHVFGTGIVDDTVPGGITQDNVERMDVQVGPIINVSYCFSGLPPIAGGQVTLDGSGTSDLVTAYFEFTDDPLCSPRVHIAGPGETNKAGNFYILLY